MNFLYLRFDVVELQIIINLSRYGSKGITSVVLGNSGVSFLGERVDAAFCPFLYCILVISEHCVVEFRCLPYFWWYFIKTDSFPVFNFFLVLR